MSEMVGLSGSGASSSTAENSAPEPKKIPGRPFVKGDKRINRHGRPRTADALKKLVIKIMNEEVSGSSPEGVVSMSRAELVIRDWLASRNFQKQNAAMERGFGKVKDEHDMQMHLDFSNLTTSQVERIAKGEDIITVLLTPNK
jgi:hypothetical protein